MPQVKLAALHCRATQRGCNLSTAWLVVEGERAWVLQRKRAQVAQPSLRSVAGNPLSCISLTDLMIPLS